MAERFPEALQRVLETLGVAPVFIEAEIAAVAEGRYAKTANRSLVGIMNEFKHLADSYRDHRGLDDLVTLAVELSGTPCKPLYSRHVSSDRELDALEIGEATRNDSIPYEDLRETYLPECAFRGKNSRKIQYVILHKCMGAGGLEPDLLDEVAWWHVDD